MTRSAVLIVDDSPFRNGLAAELRTAGFVTAQASGPSEAHGYLRNLRFDVVLVDLDRDAAGAARFLDEVGRRQPGALRLTTTAEVRGGVGLPLLRKPFGVDVLLEHARPSRSPS